VNASQISFSARRSSSKGSNSESSCCAARIVGKLERTDSLSDPLGGQLDCEVEQLRLGAEVVAERPGQPTLFLRDRSDRGALDAVSADHPPHGLCDLAAPLLVVDNFGHDHSFSHICAALFQYGCAT
jgi:hypothetical protein